MLRPGQARVADLKIDLRNPRVPNEIFDSEIKAISHLVDHADVAELVQSIGRSGWLDYEPLIVLAPDNIVIEGNRRLAALRLMSSANLRNEIKFKLPSGVEESRTLPSEVRVFYVDDRSEARDFIGFKHINGAFKWDSFAKAKYAAEWLDDEPETTVKDVSERLGDSHNTVLRLVNGYRVLRESERLGFSVEETTSPRGFSFSHLYTALPSPNVRGFLGIDSELSEVLSSDPVPTEHHADLLEYMTWLYGQVGRGEHVIKSQNPDLGRLTKVLGSQTATSSLRATGSLAEAFDIVDDKAKAFEDAIFQLLKSAREAAQQLGKYDGDPEVLTVAKTAERTVRSITAGMRSTVEDAADTRQDP